jgi:uncharacterized repeat protein (TIGR01451 family)
MGISKSSCAPCGLAGLFLVGLVLAPGAARAASYVTQTATFNFISSAGHAPITAWDSTLGCNDSIGDDSLSPAINLPFAFRFGATSYNQVRVLTNGRIQFNNTRCIFGTQAVGPPRTYTDPMAAANLANTIRVYGADLDVSAGGSITYGTSGTAPNRLFVVTWNNVPQWSAVGTSYNLQIQLGENGDFYFMYGVSSNVSGGTTLGPAQIGWELSTTDFVIVQNGLPANNSGWRFRPNVPTLTVTKTSRAFSDPTNGGVNPKRIPGGFVEYSVTVTNRGVGSVDASTVVVTDPVPANTDLFVSTASGPPVTFTDGTPASGLAFVYASNVSYSSQAGGGVPFTYPPTANTNGVDPAARGIRIAPTGTMNGATAAGNPSFTVTFRVRVR